MEKKICFFGSRSLTGDSVVTLIKQQFEYLHGCEIITAEEPKGVCEEARQYAKDNNIKLTTIPKQRDKAAGMYHHRSSMCYELADHVVLIHDGISNGTQNEFDLAVKMKLPLSYFIIGKKKQVATNSSKYLFNVATEI